MLERLQIALRLWERNEYLDRMIAAHTFEAVRVYLQEHPDPVLEQQLPLGWRKTR